MPRMTLGPPAFMVMSRCEPTAAGIVKPSVMRAPDMWIHFLVVAEKKASADLRATMSAMKMSAIWKQASVTMPATD